MLKGYNIPSPGSSLSLLVLHKTKSWGSGDEAEEFAPYLKALNAEETESLVSLSAKRLMRFAKVVLQIFLDLLRAIYIHVNFFMTTTMVKKYKLIHAIVLVLKK